MSTTMKPVDDHIAGILAAMRPLAPFEVQLLDAHGLLLAEDVVAPGALPPFDNSSMDGYAVRHQDVTTASAATPVTIKVLADIPAGTPTDVVLGPGGCARVMTGGQVPEGTDAVVPVEWTDAGTEAVVIRQAPDLGQYIRKIGDDIQAGELVLKAGTQLGPRQIGLLAAIGRDRVPVHVHPRVVVLSTGSELVEPGTEPGPGQICDSNSFMLAVAAQEAGATAFRVGIVPDDARVLLDTIEDQLIRADLVVTSGGVSVGAYDVVKEVLSQLGTVTFEKVAMQPGMPQGFGTLSLGSDDAAEAVPIFTLPGNPVSAYVSFEVFVRPAIRALLGREPLHRPQVDARLTQAIAHSPQGRRQYLRGSYRKTGGTYEVELAGGSGSHLLGALAGANCFVIVDEDHTAVAEGETVRIMLLDCDEAVA